CRPTLKAIFVVPDQVGCRVGEWRRIEWPQARSGCSREPLVVPISRAANRPKKGWSGACAAVVLPDLLFRTSVVPRCGICSAESAEGRHGDLRARAESVHQRYDIVSPAT